MSRTKDEIRAYNRAYMRAYRKTHKERDREYMRAYYKANRDRIRAYQKEYRERRLHGEGQKPKATVGKAVSKRKQRRLSLMFLRKDDRENFKWLCERMKNKRKRSEERGDASGCVKS